MANRSSRRALVIGAGAVGLSQAILLLEAGWDVHVVADKMSPHTTSDGSGGKASAGMSNTYESVEAKKLQPDWRASAEQVLCSKSFLPL